MNTVRVNYIDSAVSAETFEPAWALVLPTGDLRIKEGVLDPTFHFIAQGVWKTVTETPLPTRDER